MSNWIKIFSARFLIAIMLTATFCWLSINKMISAGAFLTILTMVIKDYFNRPDRKGEKE